MNEKNQTGKISGAGQIDASTMLTAHYSVVFLIARLLVLNDLLFLQQVGGQTEGICHFGCISSAL